MKFHSPDLSFMKSRFIDFSVMRLDVHRSRPGVALAPSSCPLHPSEAPQTQNADDAHAQRAQQTQSDLLPTPYYNQLTSDNDRCVGYMTVTMRNPGLEPRRRRPVAKILIRSFSILGHLGCGW